MTNPLLQIQSEIPFHEIEARHVEPAIDELLADARQAVERIGSQNGVRTYDDTLGALERATERLEFAMAVVQHLESVATTPELRAAYNAIEPKVSAFYSEIPTNAELFEALTSFANTNEAAALGASRARFLHKTLDDFRRHGAELDAAGKEKLQAINVKLSQLTTKFSQNVLDATNAFELFVTDEERLSGLPETAREAAAQAAQTKGKKGWRFTLQAPSVIAALTYLDDAKLREQIWRAYNTRAASSDLDNRALIRDILSLRREKASLLGYADFSDLVLEDRMAKNGAQAQEFVDDLRTRTLPFMEEEKGELLAFRRELEGPSAPALAPWDVGYYAEKLRKARYDFDEEQLRPYFPAARVLAGAFEVVQRLYGIQIEARELPTWDESVQSYAVRDEDGTLLAAFYVDLYPRENKRGGAWMMPILSRVPEEDRTEPNLGLFCANVNPPIGDKPALLDHREVETLFHEFGHLMHHVLSRVSVRSLAGTNVAWDFVELPSQIMENWCWEREALDLFARHYQTDEPIPDDLFERMTKARTYRAASDMMRQVGLATVDLALHREYDPARDGDHMEYARKILERHSSTPLPDDHAMIASFTHLFASSVAYAAGYYSYKWAEVLDADAFGRFKKEGIFSKAVGRAFRSTILETGNSRDPAELFHSFMGRQPRLEALLERSGLLPAPA